MLVEICEVVVMANTFILTTTVSCQMPHVWLWSKPLFPISLPHNSNIPLQIEK